MSRELADILDRWLEEKKIKLVRVIGDRFSWHKPNPTGYDGDGDPTRVMEICDNGTSVWVRYPNCGMIGSVGDASEPHFFESLESRLRYSLGMMI